MAAVEAKLDASQEPDEAWFIGSTGLDQRDQRSRSLVQCRCQPHESSHHHQVPRRHGTRQSPPKVTTIWVKLNRRIRNRTYGRVGGRREQSRLLPDQVLLPMTAGFRLDGQIDQIHTHKKITALGCLTPKSRYLFANTTSISQEVNVRLPSECDEENFFVFSFIARQSKHTS